MKSVISTASAILFVSFSLASTAPAVTITVPSDQQTIQSGIHAAVDGALVLVAPGTYVENIDFFGKNITLRSEDGADVTVIDGSQTRSTVAFATGESGAAVIDGFSIINGSGVFDDFGGGIICYESSPTITNCTISGNSTYDMGGGIGCYYSFPTITNCTITGNSAGAAGGINCYQSSPKITNCTISGNNAGTGGGIQCLHSNPTIVNCTISNNSATGGFGAGGGIQCIDSDPTITNCEISGNSAVEHGGGISCKGYVSPTITNCKITGNLASGRFGTGGGIFCGNSSPSVTNCTISGNTAAQDGGGIFCDTASPRFTNCTISENMAAQDGGGIFCDTSSPWVTNCTISGNVSYENGGGIYCTESSPTIRNSILWMDAGTLGREIYVESGDPTVIYSDVQGGWPGEGNIDEPPAIAAPGDFHLTIISPCIDSGTSVALDVDMDGESRPEGAGFDMGADEFIDLDGDGWSSWQDCLDTDPTISPGSPESYDAHTCADGIDNDCDGMIDTDPDCVPPACSVFMEPISRSPLTFYLIPALALIFFGRRLFRRK